MYIRSVANIQILFDTDFGMNVETPEFIELQEIWGQFHQYFMSSFWDRNTYSVEPTV